MLAFATLLSTHVQHYDRVDHRAVRAAQLTLPVSCHHACARAFGLNISSKHSMQVLCV